MPWRLPVLDSGNQQETFLAEINGFESGWGRLCTQVLAIVDKRLRAQWSAREAELRSITEENLRPINAWAREKGINHVRSP